VCGTITRVMIMTYNFLTCFR